MGSQVKLLLLAAHSSQLLAQELLSSGLRTGAISNGSVATALLEIDGTPAINHWLAAVKGTPRLLPIKDKVFIVTNADNYPAFVAWAKNPKASLGGFPVDNIINNGALGKEIVGAVYNIGLYLTATGHKEEHLVVAEADVVFEPAFSLQRVVEHSLVRAKDTVVYVVAPPGEALADHTLVGFDDPSAATPRIVAVEPCPPFDAAADGAFASVLAPLVVFRRTSLPDVAAAAAKGSGLPGTADGKQLGHLVGSLLPTRPVYGLPFEILLTTCTLSSLFFADSFYKHYSKETITNKGTAALALENATELAMNTRADPVLLSLLAVSSPTKQMFLKFHHKYQQELQQALEAAALGGTLPARFADATSRRHAPHKQHPVYETTNNMYGLKAASQVEMPDVYSGTSQAFTKAFAGGMVRDAALVTSITRSKVHQNLDEY